MLIDARHLTTGSRIECDLCIVGAGICGMSIADRLRDSDLNIVLLEGGGVNYELAAQELYRGENAGHGYFRLEGCRWRMFGGSSNRWGGWCLPLDPEDFERRSWVPYSGWPIGADALRPFEPKAAELLELPTASFDVEGQRNSLPAPLALDQTHFENILVQHSPETNFAERYGDALLKSASVTVILHANLIDMRLGVSEPRLSVLEVGTLTGRRFTVHPKLVVLATGGIENARLMLAARKDRAAGLGNEFDLVGRYFMEHLHVPHGHMLLRRGAGNNRFFRRVRLANGHWRGLLKPTRAALESRRLMTTSIGLENASFFLGTSFLGWRPSVMFAPVRSYRMLRQLGLNWMAERMKNGAHALHSIPSRVRTLNEAIVARRAHASEGDWEHVYSLFFHGEQAPDPLNRVALSPELDALGMPRTRLEWRVNPADLAAVSGWLEVLDEDMTALGLGRVVSHDEDWRERIIGGPHHMGTTRMSSDPRRGVVDADCRVHSVDNLYIAGSSVFTTSGHANPTFSMLALALRLADTLRRRLSLPLPTSCSGPTSLDAHQRCPASTSALDQTTPPERAPQLDC